ncbi:hypothetical protein GGI07_004106 [Coemansia sp. Benny D115]|nr:hypothetical protein GGI07_004106 [Coemansia sp. Benny D115]
MPGDIPKATGNDSATYPHTIQPATESSSSDSQLSLVATQPYTYSHHPYSTPLAPLDTADVIRDLVDTRTSSPIAPEKLYTRPALQQDPPVDAFPETLAADQEPVHAAMLCRRSAGDNGSDNDRNSDGGDDDDPMDGCLYSVRLLAGVNHIGRMPPTRRLGVHYHEFVALDTHIVIEIDSEQHTIYYSSAAAAAVASNHHPSVFLGHRRTRLRRGIRYALADGKLVWLGRRSFWYRMLDSHHNLSPSPPPPWHIAAIGLCQGTAVARTPLQSKSPLADRFTATAVGSVDPSRRLRRESIRPAPPATVSAGAMAGAMIASEVALGKIPDMSPLFSSGSPSSLFQLESPVAKDFGLSQIVDYEHRFAELSAQEEEEEKEEENVDDEAMSNQDTQPTNSPASVGLGEGSSLVGELVGGAAELFCDNPDLLRLRLDSIESQPRLLTQESHYQDPSQEDPLSLHRTPVNRARVSHCASEIAAMAAEMRVAGSSENSGLSGLSGLSGTPSSIEMPPPQPSIPTTESASGMQTREATDAEPQPTDQQQQEAPVPAQGKALLGSPAVATPTQQQRLSAAPAEPSTPHTQPITPSRQPPPALLLEPARRKAESAGAGNGNGNGCDRQSDEADGKASHSRGFRGPGELKQMAGKKGNGLQADSVAGSVDAPRLQMSYLPHPSALVYAPSRVVLMTDMPMETADADAATDVATDANANANFNADIDADADADAGVDTSNTQPPAESDDPLPRFPYDFDNMETYLQGLQASASGATPDASHGGSVADSMDMSEDTALSSDFSQAFVSLDTPVEAASVHALGDHHPSQTTASPLHAARPITRRHRRPFTRTLRHRHSIENYTDSDGDDNEMEHSDGNGNDGGDGNGGSVERMPAPSRPAMPGPLSSASYNRFAATPLSMSSRVRQQSHRHHQPQLRLFSSANSPVAPTLQTVTPPIARPVTRTPEDLRSLANRAGTPRNFPSLHTQRPSPSGSGSTTPVPYAYRQLIRTPPAHVPSPWPSSMAAASGIRSTAPLVATTASDDGFPIDLIKLPAVAPNTMNVQQASSQQLRRTRRHTQAIVSSSGLAAGSRVFVTTGSRVAPLTGPPAIRRRGQESALPRDTLVNTPTKQQQPQQQPQQEYVTPVLLAPRPLQTAGNDDDGFASDRPLSSPLMLPQPSLLLQTRSDANSADAASRDMSPFSEEEEIPEADLPRPIGSNDTCDIDEGDVRHHRHHHHSAESINMPVVQPDPENEHDSKSASTPVTARPSRHVSADSTWLTTDDKHPTEYTPTKPPAPARTEIARRRQPPRASKAAQRSTGGSLMETLSKMPGNRGVGRTGLASKRRSTPVASTSTSRAASVGRSDTPKTAAVQEHPSPSLRAARAAVSSGSAKKNKRRANSSNSDVSSKASHRNLNLGTPLTQKAATADSEIATLGSTSKRQMTLQHLHRADSAAAAAGSSATLHYPRVSAVITGFLDDEEQRMARQLESHGIRITDNPLEATVCLTKARLKRTPKVLCSLGRGIPIVTPAWVTELNHHAAQARQAATSSGSPIDRQSLMDWMVGDLADTHLLHDPVTEAEWGISLAATLETARSAHAKHSALLSLFCVYVAPDVERPSITALIAIARSAGGHILNDFGAQDTFFGSGVSSKTNGGSTTLSRNTSASTTTGAATGMSLRRRSSRNAASLTSNDLSLHGLPDIASGAMDMAVDPLSHSITGRSGSKCSSNGSKSGIDSDSNSSSSTEPDNDSDEDWTTQRNAPGASRRSSTGTGGANTLRGSSLSASRPRRTNRRNPARGGASASRTAGRSSRVKQEANDVPSETAMDIVDETNVEEALPSFSRQPSIILAPPHTAGSLTSTTTPAKASTKAEHISSHTPTSALATPATKAPAKRRRVDSAGKTSPGIVSGATAADAPVSLLVLDPTCSRRDMDMLVGARRAELDIAESAAPHLLIVTTSSDPVWRKKWLNHRATSEDYAGIEDSSPRSSQDLQAGVEVYRSEISSSPPPTRPVKKRAQVKNACVNCQRACKRCDSGRPCQRCVKYRLVDTCVDSKRKPRAKGIKRGPYKKRNKNLAGTDNASLASKGIVNKKMSTETLVRRSVRSKAKVAAGHYAEMVGSDDVKVEPGLHPSMAATSTKSANSGSDSAFGVSQRLSPVSTSSRTEYYDGSDTDSTTSINSPIHSSGGAYGMRTPERSAMPSRKFFLSPLATAESPDQYRQYTNIDNTLLSTQPLSSFAESGSIPTPMSQQASPSPLSLLSDVALNSLGPSKNNESPLASRAMATRVHIPPLSSSRFDYSYRVPPRFPLSADRGNASDSSFSRPASPMFPPSASTAMFSNHTATAATASAASRSDSRGQSAEMMSMATSSPKNNGRAAMMEYSEMESSFGPQDMQPYNGSKHSVRRLSHLLSKTSIDRSCATDTLQPEQNYANTNSNVTISGFSAVTPDPVCRRCLVFGNQDDRGELAGTSSTTMTPPPQKRMSSPAVSSPANSRFESLSAFRL